MELFWAGFVIVLFVEAIIGLVGFELCFTADRADEQAGRDE